MLHWRISSIAGLGAPVCARVWALPDCAARRVFARAMERVFEPDHCRRIHDIYMIGRLLRG